MSRFLNVENRVLAQVRQEYPWSGQRTLATKIVTNNFSGYFHNRINASGLNRRSFGSIYGAIRRHDDRLIAERNAGRVNPLFV